MTDSTFPDPEVLLIDGLTAAFAGRSESYKPATITPGFPTVALTTQTHVQVELELGGSDDYPTTERAQVRVTCYAPPGKRSDVKALASLAHALTCSLTGPQIAGVRPNIGRSSVITEPDTKNLMVWFLVTADLKASAL